MVQRVVDLFNGAFAKLGDNISTSAIMLARQAMASSKQKTEKPAPQMAEIRDLAISGTSGTLPAKLYTPMAAGHAPGPGLVFFHGGGFLVGNVAGYDNAVRRLAAAARIRVLSVDYRLAPEHPFPAAHDDAQAALLWVFARAETLGMDPGRISVGGDSAGGMLSSWLCQWAVQNGIVLESQLLLYPLLQLAEASSKQRKSPDSHILGKPALMAIRKHFVAGADVHDPRLAPLYGVRSSNLAPALIVTCGLDPLRVEGRAYADMLVAQGVRVNALHFSMMPHGFLNLTGLIPGAEDASLDAYEAFGRFIGTLTA
ncbi:MAG: alpha/beta hydrolase [Robiginitomaculum sp.]|nr:alpha/beta hydrolase [Robiginitomaculum sp.]